MTNITLSMDYLIKAKKRLKILEYLFDDGDYPDVVRISQEIVELALKAILRQVGIDPPKWHDVGGVLLENTNLFSQDLIIDWIELANISKWLRKEREIAFYGAVDFIPMLEYDENIAKKAMEDAKKVVESALKLVKI
jgi:HEPN domain-containing protein